MDKEIQYNKQELKQHIKDALKIIELSYNRLNKIKNMPLKLDKYTRELSRLKKENNKLQNENDKLKKALHKLLNL